MGWVRRRPPRARPPEQVLAALGGFAPGDRLLSAALTGHDWLLATTHRFASVRSDGQPAWVRPWHEVDQASWSREAETLTVSFVDGRRPLTLPVADDGRLREFLQVVRERVQASVVEALDLPLEGARRARAVIRQDLATGELLEQLVLGRGTRPSPQIDAEAALAFARLRDDTGLPP